MVGLLEFRVFIAKYFGLIFALSSGLHLGRCGPYIHLGAMITYNLSKFNFFKTLNRDSVLKIQSILIGSAVGISCTYGTPLAGIVIVVELIGKIFSIRTIWILYVTLFSSTITIIIYHNLSFYFYSLSFLYIF